MYLAMHTWMRSEPIARSIRRLPRFGISAVEIAGAPESLNVAEVRALLAETGVRCFGSVTLMTPARSLLARDEGRRADTVRYVKACVDLVQALGGAELSVVPGSVGQLVAEATPEQEWQWAVESLREINAHAERAGVRIGIEPINRFETFFINRAAQALALADAVGPTCGVCLDAFHMSMEEQDLYAAIRSARGRLVDFHIGDTNRHAPGLGMVDWPRVVATLREIGYAGPLSLEFCPPFDRTPANPFPDQAETDFSGVSAEQRKFLEDHGSNLMSEAFYERMIQQSVNVLRPLIA